jgi:hypothetical protein
MLADLRARLAAEPEAVRRRIVAKHGDMRSTRVGRRFSLITCPFNAALHLYERVDVERWLARVRDHLTPRGELVFDVSMPILEDLTRDPTVAFATPPFEHPTHGRVKYREHFDYDRVRQILFVSMCFEPIREDRKRQDAKRQDANRQYRPRLADAKRQEAKRQDTKHQNTKLRDDERRRTDAFMVPLAHRQFFPRELEALLHYNGFETMALHGDFHGGPLVQRSDVMVCHARRRRSS